MRERVRSIGRRGSIRTFLWIALGGVAAYFLLPQLGELLESLRTLEAARPGWLIVGLGLVALRYVLAVLSLQWAVGRPLPFGPTLLVQLSSSFIGRFTPEGIGWLVLNQRYLERTGIDRAAALAAITLKLLAGVLMRLVIAAMVAALVGRSGVFAVDVPRVWPLLLALLLVVAFVGMVILRARFAPTVARVTAPVVFGAKDLARIFREPQRAIGLFVASAGLTITYGFALAVSVMAFGVDVSLLDMLAVYLAGTALASASPTPGNIGAVEVALSAGLATVGIASAPAVAAVLIYRLLTFWLPVLPGFIAFRYLQKKQFI